MIIKTLYRYIRDGKTTVSPVKFDEDCSKTYRVIAEEGMAITNGNLKCECIDTDDPSEWQDCEYSIMKGEKLW